MRVGVGAGHVTLVAGVSAVEAHPHGVAVTLALLRPLPAFVVVVVRVVADG